MPDHFLGDFPRCKWEQMAQHVPQDLRGWRVLDVGCNAGFYSFELAKRGADVLAIDHDDHYLTQARWAATRIPVRGSIEFRRMQVYDLARWNETFDLVWFMGVFYHLRYPLLGLDIIASRTRKYLMFQTLTMPGEEVLTPPENLDILDRSPMEEPGWPKMAFIENRLANDETNWWAPNHAGVEALLRSSGMKVNARLGHEIYWCEKDSENRSCIEAWDRPEYLSATGQSWLTPGEEAM